MRFFVLLKPSLIGYNLTNFFYKMITGTPYCVFLLVSDGTRKSSVYTALVWKRLFLKLVLKQDLFKRFIHQLLHRLRCPS